MNMRGNWSWKDPEEKTKAKTPEVKVTLSRKERRKRKKAKQKGMCRSVTNEFYISKEWRRLRYRVLKNNDGCCMLCGRSKREHGVVLHVDHIKPKSKYPELALTYENLQVLCEDCNLGKSNKDETDWRPDQIDAEREILSEALKHI